MPAIDIIQHKKTAGATDYPTKDANLIEALQPMAAGVGWPFAYKPGTTAGLNLGYYGGNLLVDGVLSLIADGTVALAAASTNYVESSRAGVVSANTVGFTPGRIPLYTVVTSGSALATLTDVRAFNQPAFARLALASTGGTVTLSADQARAQMIDITGALASNLTIEVPAVPWAWSVSNGTTNAFSVTLKVAGQAGVMVPQGKRRLCVCDGADVRAHTGYVASDGDTMTGLLTLSADPSAALHAATKQYVDSVVVGLLDDRGSYDASGNVWPSAGGSGTAGAIKKGDLWYISVAGTLGGTAVTAGNTIRALVDTPGQTSANWDILDVDVPEASETTPGRVELATSAETQTGTDAVRAVTPAGLAAAAVFQGKHSFYLPAAAFRPRANNGCAAMATSAGAANQPDVDYIAFDSAAVEYARVAVQMPRDYNGGSISAKFCWRRASGTGAANVVFGLRALAVGDNESPVANFGAGAKVIDDAKTTPANFALSGETTACTIAGTPAAGELVFVEVYRDATDGTDTLDGVDAWVSGVTVFYTTNARNEA